MTNIDDVIFLFTDVVTWILIGTGVAIILIGAAILVALR